MFCICFILHILRRKYFGESFEAFFTLEIPSNTGTNFCTFCLHSSWWSWRFSVIGLNSGKFLSLYLGPFSCKVQILEKDRGCLFLVQDFVYSNESLVEESLFFTFSSWESNSLHMRRKYAYLRRNLYNTIKLPIFVFIGDPINKNRVVIVWKGYYNVIHFSIIRNFYISMYPVNYWPWYI